MAGMDNGEGVKRKKGTRGGEEGRKGEEKLIAGYRRSKVCCRILTS